jgi:hypothetical protein
MSQIRERAFYVYGFTRTATRITGSEEDAEPTEGGFGEGFDKGDSPHLWHGGAGISAIVCMVDHDDFVRQPGDYRMTNFAWIASRVVKHQAVLEKAMNAGPILPLRFGTLFASEEMLGEFLSRHSGTISLFLSRMETCQEWTLQGYCDTSECEKSIRSRILPEEDTPGGTNPFAEALLDKFREREVKKMAQEWVDGRCRELFISLVPFAVNSSERRLLPNGGHPETCEMVANWAFLIDKTLISDFQRLVERLSSVYAAQGLTFHLSGPWPPFSFCPSLDEDTMDD